MFPIRDSLKARRTPVINYLLIAVCAVMFVWQLLSGPNQGVLVERLGMVPARLTIPAGEIIAVPEATIVPTIFGYQEVQRLRPLESALIPEWLTLFTCIFLHGGWLHFLGNMWFLFIFGDNVEDRLGHVAYAVLYLGCGLISGIAHTVTNFDSVVPTIGASGAIAGVMGAYMSPLSQGSSHDHDPIDPAVARRGPACAAVLGIWFALQFFNGAFAITDTQAGGVAWWAHIGGFVAGAAIAAGLNALHGTDDPLSRVEEPAR